MRSRLTRNTLLILSFLATLTGWSAEPQPPARRLVILKVDGMGHDLLQNAIEERDPSTGKSQLPWLSHIFAERGAVYQNFYTRGISLSAPSWSMLDTGHPTIIRGNAEYDRFTGEVYDYLNFFPLYVGYARKKQVDMPAVEVLDRAGVPLLIDRYQYPDIFQSFQLFQRGVRWSTLKDILKRKFSGRGLFSALEGSAPSYDSLLERQTQDELESGLKTPEILYLDLFIGRVDHEGHATSDPGAMLRELRQLDRMAGQIWTAIQASPKANDTLFVMVSDHGMNNVPGIISQTFGITDLLNSPAGGAHHVVTNRAQLSDFKFKSLNPLAHRFISPSDASPYLQGEAARYPTAWLDLDGNERAAVHLRNSELNKIHILLLQIARPELADDLRKAAARALRDIIGRQRASWSKTIAQLDEEMKALKVAMDARKSFLDSQPRKFEDKVERSAAWRSREEYDDWKEEYAGYSSYSSHLKKLLALEPESINPTKLKIGELVPEMSLGDPNTREQLRHYVVGPTPAGLQLAADGSLDEERSFRFVDYPRLFCEQRARNKPQRELADKPIDFVTMRLADDASGDHVYWLYGSEENQLEILTTPDNRISVRPGNGVWRSGLPLALFEDQELRIPLGSNRQQWLSNWHTEKEWLTAIHKTAYSNGVIGIVEELSPVGERVPGTAGMDAVTLRYERRRRELVQADIHLFAADHWNFNVRFPNPGGNHGGFLRISTHSVWMMAGAGVQPGNREEPVDSLEFAKVVLDLLKQPVHH